MSIQPLVSVIIPTYQHAETIVSCLQSVFDQTYAPVEIIVVDDGSTDSTQEVLRPYVDRIEYHYQKNLGSNPARNAGWGLAKGEYLLFVDADVVLDPSCIEVMYKALQERPECSVAYSGFYFGFKRFSSFAFSPERLREMNYIHTTSLVRASDFPGFDPSIRRLQDWDVWLTMVEQGKKGVWIDAVLFSVSVSGTSRIGSSWLPSFVYRIPWHVLGWSPRPVRRYFEARDLLFEKHQL